MHACMFFECLVELTPLWSHLGLFLKESFSPSGWFWDFIFDYKRRGLLFSPTAAAAKALQSCPTLWDPIDGSPPGSPSLGFSRQEHWSGLPRPPPEDLPHPGIEPESLVSPALQVAFFLLSHPGSPFNKVSFKYGLCHILFPISCCDYHQT